MWSDVLSADALEIAKRLRERAVDESDKGTTIYPPTDKIFRALELVPPENVSCCILGQDPYHGPMQANGLAFSVEKGVPLPPSLRNIFRELHSDLGIPVSTSGDLTPWAMEGVLMLNTSLTVEEGKPGSHSRWGWQDFVIEVLTACLHLPQPIVFLLWGQHAISFTKTLQIEEHPNKIVFCSSHPSPLGATKGNATVPAFLGSKPFSKANEFLCSAGADPIDWSL